MFMFDGAIECPQCNKNLTACSHFGDDGPDGPTPGDISVCIGCAELLEFDEDLQLITIRPDTIDSLDFTQLQKFMAMAVEIRTRRGEYKELELIHDWLISTATQIILEKDAHQPLALILTDKEVFFLPATYRDQGQKIRYAETVMKACKALDAEAVGFIAEGWALVPKQKFTSKEEANKYYQEAGDIEHHDDGMEMLIVTTQSKTGDLMGSWGVIKRAQEGSVFGVDFCDPNIKNVEQVDGTFSNLIGYQVDVEHFCPDRKKAIRKSLRQSPTQRHVREHYNKWISKKPN